MKNQYRTATDLSIIILLILGGTSPIIGSLFTSGQLGGVGLEAVISTAIVLAIYGCVLPINYRLDEQALRVRSGLIKWEVRYEDISSVVRSNTLMAGPALSFSRLEIHRRNGRTLVISPADSDGFFQELQTLLPGAELTSAGLTVTQ